LDGYTIALPEGRTVTKLFTPTDATIRTWWVTSRWDINFGGIDMGYEAADLIPAFATPAEKRKVVETDLRQEHRSLRPLHDELDKAHLESTHLESMKENLMSDPTNRAAQNAIVAPQPLAVEEGARVLMAGGNAIDAAVTCAFVQAIVDPQMCGIGGYACLNLHLAAPEGGAGAAKQVGLDAPALAGSQVTPDMWVDQIIGPNPDGWGYFLQGRLNDAGYTSICTPGWVRAMATILERWGTISWADALAPAAQIAEEGFVVGERMGTRWLMRARFPEACELIDYIKLNPEASRIYLKADGSPYRVGERLRNPDYARTLRHLGERGPDDFYHGELARTMMADLAAHGAYVTTDDLASYRLREDQLVTGTYRGYTVTSADRHPQHPRRL
jgi:gamma-glutamyltranspeptidase